MSLLDTINAVGDAVTDGVESGIESSGQAIDSVYDWFADVSDSAGFESFSDFMRLAGDAIANATGGPVDELELGQTGNPRELIRGNPEAIGSTAQTLTTLAERLESTCTALGSIETGDWSGDAAVSFRDTFTKQRQLWADSADAMTRTAQQLTFWQQTVETAQGKAADAIALWEQAETARQTQNDEKPSNAWKGQFQEAREILNDARAARTEAAAAVAGAIAKATSDAPTEPAFSDRMLSNLADARPVAEFGALSTVKGFVNGGTGLVQFVRQISPSDPYNFTHPAEYIASLSDKAAGATDVVAHPGAAASAALEDFRTKPFESVGGLFFDAALAGATGGAGTAISLGRYGARLGDGENLPEAERTGTDEQVPEATPDKSVPGESVEMGRFEATEFRTAYLTNRHFVDHGTDFEGVTKQEYVRMAVKFFSEAQANNYPAKYDEETDRIRIFDPATNRFGSYYSDGTIATFFKPTNDDYWDKKSPGYGSDVIWVD